jgi:3-methyladenine DNA glycosylase AlkD
LEKRSRVAKSESRTALSKTVVAVEDALSSLEKMSTKRDRENLARFGITAKKAFGVSMANTQVLAKRLGRSHELAAALWETGWYEARLLTSFVDEPARVTSSQMDRWCRDFDNWGVCDTLCFHLFDRTPHAWAKVRRLRVAGLSRAAR